MAHYSAIIFKENYGVFVDIPGRLRFGSCRSQLILPEASRWTRPETGMAIRLSDFESVNLRLVEREE